MSYTNELSELNKQNQELKSELYDIEVLIGHKIIKDSNTTIEPELKSEYFSIQSDLEAKNKDLEISKSCNMLEIDKIANKLNIDNKYLENYGKYKAKIS